MRKGESEPEWEKAESRALLVPGRQNSSPRWASAASRSRSDQDQGSVGCVRPSEPCPGHTQGCTASLGGRELLPEWEGERGDGKESSAVLWTFHGTTVRDDFGLQNEPPRNGRMSMPLLAPQVSMPGPFASLEAPSWVSFPTLSLRLMFLGDISRLYVASLAFLRPGWI